MCRSTISTASSFSSSERQFGVSGGAGDTAGVENGEEIEADEGCQSDVLQGGMP